MKKLFFIILFLFVVNFCFAENITLQWDANIEPDLAGYKIYYKVGSGGEPYNGVGIFIDGIEKQSPIDVGNVTEISFTVQEGQTYFFAATAYDNETPLLESDYSNEVSVYIPNVWEGNPPSTPILHEINIGDVNINIPEPGEYVINFKWN